MVIISYKTKRGFEELKGKIGEFLQNAKKYWSEPAPGRNVPFKEIACYGVGGMGVYFATALASAIGLSAGNLIVGASLQIDPMHLQAMNIIACIFGFFVTMVLICLITPNPRMENFILG